VTSLLHETWDLGGPLSGLGARAAGLEFAGVVVVGLLVAWLSYRRAIRRLGALPRLVLVVLRTAMLMLLLVCLANPVRIERVTAVPPAPPAPKAESAATKPRKLAVVVDRSDSMLRPDNRGITRLAAALDTWKRLQAAAEKTFAQTEYFSFAQELSPARSLTDASGQKGRSAETLLYRSVADVLTTRPAADRPDAVVVLTDGVDTSAATPTALEEAALQAKVPIYFVAGINRTRATPFLRVREWRVPPTTRPNTQFTLEATFEAFSQSDRTVPISLWVGTHRMAVGRIRLTRGTNLIPWQHTLTAGEPGLLDCTLRFGETAADPIAARSLLSVVKLPTRVLIYQSVLDWSEGFLVTALRNDPDFRYVTLIDARSGLRIASSTGWGGQVIGSLPVKPEAYSAFDCVALLHLYPEKLSGDQQQALVEYARNGGGVLFVSPDGAALPQFATSPLAALLPVVVPSGTTRTARNPLGELTAFQLTAVGRNSPIFVQDTGAERVFVVPKFIEYATVTEVKPAAEVLAVAEDAGVNDLRHVLLASQSFGRGRSTFLGTDGLWRWKMNESSNSHAYETFWQQLILASARRPDPAALHFARPLQGTVGQATALRLSGVAGRKDPVVHAQAPSGRRVELIPQAGAQAGEWSVTWTPDEPGDWEMMAEQPNVVPAYLYLAATTEPTGELAATPPSLDSMRAIAAATGGALLNREPPAAWSPAEKAPERKAEKPLDAIVTERRRLRWNQWPVLAGILGLYGLELLLRRWWKLV
jgi:uncharacterized membrane protein